MGARMDATPDSSLNTRRGVSLFTRLFLLILLCALPPLVGLGWKMMDTNAQALE